MVATPIAAPTDNEVAFDETNTSWGNGQGISGEVLAPENIEELGELISSLEFKATLGSTDIPIRYSNLDAKILTQVNGLEGGSSTNLWNNWSKGDSWNGQSSYTENGNYVIEYGEDTKTSWGSRNVIRTITDAGIQNGNGIYNNILFWIF